MQRALSHCNIATQRRCGKILWRGGWPWYRCDNLPDMTAPTALSSPTLLTAPPLRRRMACWMYEGMLLFAVVFVADYLFSSLTQSRHGLENRMGRQGFLFVVFGIYFVWFWAKGQTLAMKTWHIRVVDRQGHAVTQPRALLRYLLSWFWLLPPLALSAALGASGAETSVLMIGWVLVWALLSRFHPERQFLHDALAGTRLVHDTTEPVRRPAP
jgi:uncharacterized RDD family membrane protein YckC